MNQLVNSSAKQSISSRRYFSYVGVFTLFLILLYVLDKPVLKYQISEQLGLTKTVKVSQEAFFNQRVQPILERYCSACHDERKAKGHLRLDNFVQARYSGKSGHNVVPFEPENSLLIARMLLDENDKRLMPPLGWDRLTEDEITVLKLWIQQGASPVLTAAAFPTAPLPVAEVKIPVVDYAVVNTLRQPVLVQLTALNKRFPHAFSFVASNSHLLRFTTVSMQQPLTDQAFLGLLDIAPNIASLYLRDVELTEQSSAVLLAMKQVTDAYLDGVDVTENTLIKFINNQKNLQRITVNNVLVTKQVKALCLARNIEISGSKFDD